MRRLILPLVGTSFVVVSLLTTSVASAENDCPPGSVHKTQDGFTWCEPTVCAKDSQCKDDEVCRPVGLCLEVGTLADAATGDGPKRLVVTQRCAPDKTCPQKQTCSDLDRCLSKTAADKMGLLNAPATSAPDSQGAPSKKACGCDLVGTRTSGGGALVAGLAIAISAMRRRRDVSPRARA